jgi:4-amino-4-deoxy-L-arabinose transferase-like glycosyltransferase
MHKAEVESKSICFIDKFLNSKSASLWIFLFGLAVFAIGYRPEFISFQTRFALFAKEMLLNGPTWFPTAYGTPYPDYPATSTFLIYLFSLPSGEVTPFISALPTAITSALILVVTYRTGALRSRRWGVSAAMVLILTWEFVSDSRSISLDQYTSLATVLCFYIVYSATVLGKSKRLFFLPLLFAAGFVFRGPIGLVVPLAVVCSYYLFGREIRNLIVVGISGTVVLGICWAFLSAAARMQGGEALVKQILQSQFISRISGDGRTSYLYYWVRCFANYSAAYITAIAVVASRWQSIMRKADEDVQMLGNLTLWVLVVMVGFTISDTRHIRYILPAAPAFSLISAYMFDRTDIRGLLHAAKDMFIGFCNAFPFLVLSASAVFAIYSMYSKWHITSNFVVSFICGAGLSAVTWKASVGLRGHREREFVLLTLAALSMIVLQAGVVEPINYKHESSKAFIAKVESLRAIHKKDIVFYKLGPDAEDIKFMANANNVFIPVFIDKVSKMENYRDNSYFITQEKQFGELPEEIRQQTKLLFTGNIGHKKCVLFERAVSAPVKL